MALLHCKKIENVLAGDCSDCGNYDCAIIFTDTTNYRPGPMVLGYPLSIGYRRTDLPRLRTFLLPIYLRSIAPVRLGVLDRGHANFREPPQGELRVVHLAVSSAGRAQIRGSIAGAQSPGLSMDTTSAR